MGLDMYLTKANKWIDANEVYDQEIFNEVRLSKDQPHPPVFNDVEFELVGSWRKHSDLHGFFEELWRDRTEEDEKAFNCCHLVLTEWDIRDTLAMIKLHLEAVDEDNQPLPGKVPMFAKASGFFWGETYREQWVETVDIFERVLEKTDFDKETILYTSWW